MGNVLPTRLLDRIFPPADLKNACIEIGGIQIEVRYKKIKSLRLSVHATDDVRLTAPVGAPVHRLREFLLSKHGWIQKQQARFLALPPLPPKPLMQTGELHYFQGKALRLNIIVQGNRLQRVELNVADELQLFVSHHASVVQREAVLQAFYREHLQREIPLLIAKWQPLMNVNVAAWGVKKMKTRWGSCNIRAHRIWLSLELAKHSPQCLEYVVVHEMVHLLERYHNERFKKFMDQFLPHWRLLKKELNHAAAGHDDRVC
ncbi:MAG: hypothetical protein QG652_1507 [Pseudomonadota bacterium]|nr:hypothetical protein [Pseudomonadota bacterium]